MPTNNNNNRKRKRRSIDSITNDDRATPAQSMPVANLLLRGKVIVVSTQQQTTTPTTITVVTSALERSSPSRDDITSISLHNCHDDTSNNNEASIQSKNYTYKSLTKLCEQMGAKVVGQVHARVHCVLATNAAVGLQRSDDDDVKDAGDGLEKTTTTTMNLPTQRVRKAWNRCIPVVRIQWIFDCIDQKFLLPLHDKYLHVQQQQQQQQNQPSVKSNMFPKPDLAGTDHNKNYGDDDANVCEEKVIDLGCCCVCHEDERPHCEWCINCSVNMST
jgi:BRCT domain, a BRCA1 C-terminus domain